MWLVLTEYFLLRNTRQLVKGLSWFNLFISILLAVPLLGGLSYYLGWNLIGNSASLSNYWRALGVYLTLIFISGFFKSLLSKIENNSSSLISNNSWVGYYQNLLAFYLITALISLTILFPFLLVLVETRDLLGMILLAKISILLTWSVVFIAGALASLSTIVSSNSIIRSAVSIAVIFLWLYIIFNQPSLLSSSILNALSSFSYASLVTLGSFSLGMIGLSISLTELFRYFSRRQISRPYKYWQTLDASTFLAKLNFAPHRIISVLCALKILRDHRLHLKIGLLLSVVLMFSIILKELDERAALLAGIVLVSYFSISFSSILLVSPIKSIKPLLIEQLSRPIAYKKMIGAVFTSLSLWYWVIMLSIVIVLSQDTGSFIQSFPLLIIIIFHNQIAALISSLSDTPYISSLISYPAIGTFLIILLWILFLPSGIFFSAILLAGIVLMMLGLRLYQIAR